MDDLQTIIRKLTGRELTDAERDLAEKNTFITIKDSVPIITSTQQGFHYFKDGENFIVQTNDYWYDSGLTYNSSIGWKPSNHSERRVYNKDGFLIKKTISRKAVILGKDHKEIKYDSPGSLIGEEI